MYIQSYNYLPEIAKQIRKTVFIEEQGFESDYDPNDDIAAHIVISDGRKAIATCRVFESGEDGIYILGRLAVLKQYRGKGVGTKALVAAEEYVKSIGGKALKLHSQCAATEFYKKAGYTEYGEIECEQGCPHIWMQKYLG